MSNGHFLHEICRVVVQYLALSAEGLCGGSRTRMP